MCEERTRTFEPARARAAETLKLERTLFDLDRQILQHNLHGVDLNAGKGS